MRLGAEPITSLDDNNKRAKLCKAHYDSMKEKMLYEHPWKFAIVRETLTAEVDAPEFGFDTKFELPYGYLRAIFEVNGEYTDETPHTWQREGEFLLANDSEIKMRYIANVGEEKFSPSFTDALALHMAHELSYALVQSASYRDQLKKDRDDSLRTARSYNAQEGVAQRVTDDSFIYTRLS